MSTDKKPASESETIEMPKETKAQKHDRKVRIMSLADYEGRPDDKKKSKKNKKDKGEKVAKVKGEKSERKRDPAKLDKFGNRLGSKKATINTMLSKKPIKMSVIKEKMGQTWYNHLNALINAGYVVQSSDGYALAE